MARPVDETADRRLRAQRLTGRAGGMGTGEVAGLVGLRGRPREPFLSQLPTDEPDPVGATPSIISSMPTAIAVFANQFIHDGTPPPGSGLMTYVGGRRCRVVTTCRQPRSRTFWPPTSPPSSQICEKASLSSGRVELDQDVDNGLVLHRGGFDDPHRAGSFGYPIEPETRLLQQRAQLARGTFPTSRHSQHDQVQGCSARVVVVSG